MIAILSTSSFAAKGGKGKGGGKGGGKPPKTKEIIAHLTWDASETLDIDGYIVYQDDVAPFIMGNFLEYYAVFVPKPDVPTCFFVTAYKGNEKSIPSNTVCK